MEILAVGTIIFLLFNYLGNISFNKFVQDNEVLFSKLKEDDFDFLVSAKYGDKVDPNLKFRKRIQTCIIFLLLGSAYLVTNFNIVTLIIVFILVYLVYKNDYNSLKGFYKSHLHEINLLLPYYLKSLEILIQHYTVPVAITKSLEQAPDMFKDGLRELIGAIDAGDSTIEPYMDFAKRYPVRDSMRMMRLLYRLGLGNQERKQEQLIVFSRTISTLQAKSRETKYKERLEKMEKKTMIMLSTTGVGVMIILVLSILQMFTF